MELPLTYALTVFKVVVFKTVDAVDAVDAVDVAKDVDAVDAVEGVSIVKGAPFTVGKSTFLNISKGVKITQNVMLFSLIATAAQILTPRLRFEAINTLLNMRRV